MLKELWKTRQKQHIQTMLKYMKYIFNDHFVLVLFICLGFLMMTYAHFILNITPDMIKHPFFKWSLILLLVCSVLIGQLATLLKPADSHFLSTLESEWTRYFNQAKIYSMIVPTICCISIFIMIYPLLNLLHMPFDYLLIVMALTLKWGHLTLSHWSYKRQNLQSYHLTITIFIGSLVGFTLGFYVSMLLATFLCLCIVWGIEYVVANDKQIYQWEYMLHTEIKRQNKICRFMQLFVDVPLYQDNPKPRKYLNFLLTHTDNMSIYFMERLFLRASHYLGLTIRLSAVNLVIMLFLPYDWGLIGLSLATAYVTAFQLLPLYVHYRDEMFLLALPVRLKEKQSAFQNVLKKILTVQLLFTQVIGGILIQHLSLLMSTLVTLLFIYYILPLYIKRKIDTM